MNISAMNLRLARTGLALAAFALPAPALKADILHARYSVSLIGLTIGDARATGKLESGTYRLDLSATLTGVAAMISSLRMAFVSTGSLHKGLTAPASYATTSGNAVMTRTVRIALNSGNVKAVDIAPPFEDNEGRVPVTEANKRNVLDPASALIMAVPLGEPLTGPSACNRTLPVFDGFARYNISMSYVSTREVSVPGYTGPVSVCAARYYPIAGHKLQSASTKFMAENRQIEVWLAPVERAHVVVPFHVSLMTLAGMVNIEASEFLVEPGEMTAVTH